MTGTPQLLHAPARLLKGTRVDPLLGFLAGEHAAALAQLWPAPHAGFYALPTARRHAAAIMTAGLASDAPVDEARMVRMLERERDNRLAAILAGEPAPGLMKAMAKMGEQLWSRDDYARFLDLFAEPEAGRALRHMGNIRPGKFAVMLALPDVLRQPKVLENVTTVPAARNLRAAFDLAVASGGGGAAMRLTERWGRAKDRATLFKMAAEDLFPEEFVPLRPRPVLPLPFEAVTSRKQLAEVALQFENCLRDFASDVGHGRMAVYVWRGNPNAAVALCHDAAGWRLAEAKIKGNGDVPEPELRQIVDTARKAGVRTGQALNILAGWLERHAGGGENHEAACDCYRCNLALGELWD